jgi:Holliday junction resolvasome RuvABC endonuclease subunit
MSKAKSEGVRVGGADVSLNHGALVVLKDGKLADFAYYTRSAGIAAKSKRGTRMPEFKDRDPHIRSAKRLAWLEHWWDKTALMRQNLGYLAIEDYAIGAAQGAHQLGEVGGIVRILSWFRGVRVRLHDPVALKMFVAHHGQAEKCDMEAAVSERWGMDFSHLASPPAKSGKQSRETAEDLADAAGLAYMAWTEIQVRSGHVPLKDLHEYELRVFNRTTKHQPLSLLDREWIHNPDGVPTPHGEPVCDVCGSRKCCLAKKKVV